MGASSRWFWATVILLLIAALPVTGGEPTPPDRPQLRVDTGASRVYVKVGSTTRLGHDHGVVGKLVSGEFKLGGAGELVFDMRSFVADPPEARSHVGLSGKVSAADGRKTTATMLGKDVLNVERHPEAHFKFRSATPLNGQAAGGTGQYRLDGEFTLCGVSRMMPLTAVVERTGEPGVLRMRCEFAILQSEFGITPYRAIGGLVGVNDQLRIWGDLTLRPLASTTAATRSSNTPH